MTWVVPRPHRLFQNALLLLHRRGRRWHVVADIYHQSCPRVPTRVLLDLQRFFATKEPRFIAPGVHGYSGCAGRVANAR